MRRIVIAGALTLSACSFPQGAAQRAWPRPVTMTPYEAIFAAAEAAAVGVPGIFVMHVAATGRQDGNLYLNSEVDYRDQRSLTIVLGPQPQRQFRERYGVEADVYLRGRDIRVSGDAMRVRIDFTVNGRHTEKYYYQTHVVVADASQIVVEPVTSGQASAEQ